MALQDHSGEAFPGGPIVVSHARSCQMLMKTECTCSGSAGRPYGMPLTIVPAPPPVISVMPAECLIVSTAIARLGLGIDVFYVLCWFARLGATGYNDTAFMHDPRPTGFAGTRREKVLAL